MYASEYRLSKLVSRLPTPTNYAMDQYDVPATSRRNTGGYYNDQFLCTGSPNAEHSVGPILGYRGQRLALLTP